MSDMEDMKRSIVLLDAQVRHLQERLRSLEKTGQTISLLPAMVQSLHPVTPPYPFSDQVLLAVTLEENETQAPVIMVAKESLQRFLSAPVGNVCTLEDYQKTPHVAQKKFVPKEGWIWECKINLAK